MRLSREPSVLFPSIPQFSLIFLHFPSTTSTTRTAGARSTSSTGCARSTGTTGAISATRTANTDSATSGTGTTGTNNTTITTVLPVLAIPLVILLPHSRCAGSRHLRSTAVGKLCPLGQLVDEGCKQSEEAGRIQSGRGS